MPSAETSAFEPAGPICPEKKIPSRPPSRPLRRILRSCVIRPYSALGLGPSAFPPAAVPPAGSVVRCRTGIKESKKKVLLVNVELLLLSYGSEDGLLGGRPGDAADQGAVGSIGRGHGGRAPARWLRSPAPTHTR